MNDFSSKAQAWAEADAPIIWLLGKTQSGKTSIVAQMTNQAHDKIGNDFEPFTKEARIYAFPEDNPVLKFLDTRGLSDTETYNPTIDIVNARQQANLIMVVVRVNDLELDDILKPLIEARKIHSEWNLIFVQSTLHNCYTFHDNHPFPYPFSGIDEDFNLPGIPYDLLNVMKAQRHIFSKIPAKKPPVFVPLDFTTPEQAIPPSDYGIDQLWSVLGEELPKVVEGLKKNTEGNLDNTIRTKVILPWALAAAAVNAVPVPVLGGLGSASLQATMVKNIAQRFDFDPSLELWREFISTLGIGFALGFGGSWLAQQVLKLGLGLGTAAVASWTFAVTWGIGEAALYYFREKKAGRQPNQEDIREKYREAFEKAKEFWRQYKGQASEGLAS